MTRVKICGITNCEDAKLACDFGADAIGLVFYQPSPRNVSIEKAVEIVHSLPPFTSNVALFVNETKENIDAVLNQVPIDIIQFHGDESPEFCAFFSRPFIKAVRMKDGLDFNEIQHQYHNARGLLLDTYKKGVPGGTGESFDWYKVPHDLKMPIILAGGLKPENISDAIEQVSPYAVDVSGGVEATKGIKDLDKIKRFMSAVRRFN